MKFIQKVVSRLLNASFAKSAAGFMRDICGIAVFLLALCLALACMGRQTFTLHTDTGNYDRAIYAEKDHDPSFRMFTVDTSDDIHVWTDDGNKIGLVTHIALSLMYAFQIVPVMLAYWFLRRVFGNVRKGEIFTEQNASCLLYYGLLQFFTALFVPLLKLLICKGTEFIFGSRISILTGRNLLNTLIPSIAFIVAAYIIHYGIHLQDEVDHTL